MDCCWRKSSKIYQEKNNKEMNILFIIGKYPNFGGTEKITEILAHEFLKDGHNVHIASFEQPRMDILPKWVNFHKLSLPVNSKNNERLIREIIVKENINNIFNQWCLPFSTTVLCNKARKGTNCKLLSVLHGVPDRSKKVIVAEDQVTVRSGIKKLVAKIKLYLINIVIRQSERYVYKHSDQYVVLSKGFIKSFCDYTGLNDLTKLTFIGNPITIPTDYSTDFLSRKKKQILYVGRMDMENKRVNRIIDTWKSLYKDYPDWNLCLVGDGPHRRQLEKMVSDNDIERVNFTGFIKEEPIDYYKESSILMLTSDLEGFGLVIVEGMCYGVIPVVYGSYVSIYDIIESGRHGYITPTPFSIEETACCLRKLMDNDELRKRMGQESIARSKDFLLEATMKEWYNLLKRI